MIKKAEEKFLNKVMKALEKEELAVIEQVTTFYENGERVEMISPSIKDPFAAIFDALRKDTPPHDFTEEQMKKKCFQIRDYVKQGKPDNIEINLMKMIQRSNGSNHNLHNTLIKVLAKDATTPIYIHLTKDDVLTSLLFIGGDDSQAFLVTENENNKETVVMLSEFNLLSISENSTPEREVGLMTSYSWLGTKVHSSIIVGMNLNPVKNLLGLEGLRSINKSTQKINKIEQENTYE